MSLTTNSGPSLLRLLITLLKQVTLGRIASISTSPTTSSNLNLVLIQPNSSITTISISVTKQLSNNTKGR